MFRSPWRFKNAYQIDEFIDQSPLFTTKTDDFEGWIDHIWVNSAVHVEKVLSVPVRSSDFASNRISGAFQPIPNQVSIVCQLIFVINLDYLLKNVDLLI